MGYNKVVSEMKKLYSGSILRRLLPPLGLLVVLLLFLGLTLLRQQHKKELDNAVAKQIEFFHYFFRENLKKHSQSLSMAALPLSADENIQKALYEGNREELLRLGLPLFEKLKISHNLTHFHYFSAERISVLRLHRPEFNGDLIERFTAIAAERTRKQASGIELGLLGTLTMRVVQPIFYKGQLSGYLELGKDIRDILAENPVSGAEKAVFVNKSYLKAEFWKNGMDMIGRTAEWETFSDVVMIYASSDFLSDYLLRNRQVPGIGGGESVEIESALGKRICRFAVLPLFDVSGVEIGALLVACDITAEKRAFYAILRRGMFAGLLLLGFLLGFIYMLLRRTDRAMIQQRADLARSEELYRFLVGGLPDVIMRFDANYAHLFVSENVVNVTGIPAADFIGRTYGEMGFSEEQCLFWEKAIGEVFTKGSPFETEFSFDSVLGTVFFDWRLVPEFNADGSVQSVLSIARDVTARKMAERDYRALFTEMIDASALHEIICDENDEPVDYRFLAVNPAFECMTGLKGEDIIGKTVLEVLPKTEAHWIKTYGQVALSGEAVHFENFSAEIDKYFEVKAFSPEKGLFVCIFADITERRRAEEVLRKSHERLEVVMDSMDAIVYIADINSHEVLFANSMVRAQCGENILGGKCWRTFQNQDGPCAFCTNEKLLDKHGKPTGIYRWIHHNHQDGRWYDCRDRAIQWIDGRMVRMEIATDITEFKALEEQLLQSQKMESIGRLAGGVAHDFNNMLSVISGYSEMGIVELNNAGAVNKEGLLNKLQEIKKAAESSANLTRQLLAFSRKQTISPRVLNINETISSMLKMLQRLIGEDIFLTWLPSENDCTVFMDPSQLDQILVNLCVNARDAINGIGKLTIETAPVFIDENYCSIHAEASPGQYVLLTVSDNGCGMSKETVSKVFEPFFTTKGLGKGTGLGLPTVYGIVKQNNGFVNVYSELSRGSVFKVYLPYHVMESETLKQFKADEIVADSGDEGTVLLVEDEPAILQMTVMMLETTGYTVLSAPGSEGALTLAEKYDGDINLLITDVIMPDMNGRELAEKLKRMYPEIKILFMSGYTANVIAHHGVLDEGVNFIQKPFTRNELREKMREILNDPVQV
jgi:PAS domain S-box-containing protein